jgi:hypothetical protein
MSAVGIAREFDALLPQVSTPVRIASFSDAQVFMRRWAIRDKDRTVRALLKQMERANSVESADLAIKNLRRELSGRGLLPETP